jgi:hypothetical protein
MYLKHAVEAANRGCSGCRILTNGVAVLRQEIARIPRLLESEADHYDFYQRVGYSVFFWDNALPRWQPEMRCFNETSAGLCVTLNVRNGEDDDFGTTADLDFFVTEDADVPWTKLGVSRHTSGDTSSEASFQRALGWLGKCVKEHSTCGGFKAQPFPDRVLDLGSPSSS